MNIKMLGSVDSNNKLQTWSAELGPYNLGLGSLQNDTLAKVSCGESETTQQCSPLAKSLFARETSFEAA